MTSKLDPRFKSKQFARILRNARERNGIESQGELVELTGIPPSTFYLRMRDMKWSLPQLVQIFKVANFSDKEKLEVIS